MGIDLRLIIAMGLTGFIAFWLISGTSNPLQTSRRNSRRRWLRVARITGVVLFLSAISSVFMTAGSFAEAYRNSVLLALLVIVPLFMLHGTRSLLKERRHKPGIHDEGQPDEEPGVVDSAGIPEFVVPVFAINAADDASLANSIQAVEAVASEQAAEFKEFEASKQAVDSAEAELAEAVSEHADMTMNQEANLPAAYPDALETDVLALNDDDADEDIDGQLDRMTELMEAHDLGVEPEPLEGGEIRDDNEEQKSDEPYEASQTAFARTIDADQDPASSAIASGVGQLTTGQADAALLATQESGLETALTALHQDNRRLQKLLIAQQSALDIERKSHENTRLAEQHAVELAQRAVASRAVAIKRLRQEAVARQRLAMRTRDAAAALKNAVSMLDSERARHAALKKSYAKMTEGV